jgi:serine/threonine protein kinase
MYLLEEGKKFERYLVRRVLGRSYAGMSYEAEDTKQHRHVTLKLIHPWSLLPDAIRRQFFRDMQEISSLSHPALTTTLNYGEMNGQLYIARSFVEHGSLLGNAGRHWFSPPLDTTKALTYIIHIAHALVYIHKCGYIHGSLTFSNLLALRVPHSPDQVRLLLSDTGLTSIVQRLEQPRTSPLRLPITAAPEQFQNRLTPASDQYALAVLLYFWLTGHLPFIGSHTEIEHLKKKENIPSLCTLNPNVTEAYDHVMRKALSAHPKDRYPSMETFISALQNLLCDTETVAYTQEQTTLAVEPSAQCDPKNLRATPMAHLVITSPYTSEPDIFQLVQENTTIGRAGSSDLLLDQDAMTSRHHALIKQNNGQHVIYDSRSTHGVFVNQHKINAEVGYHLHNGDHITIGDYTLIFYCEE